MMLYLKEMRVTWNKFQQDKHLASFQQWLQAEKPLLIGSRRCAVVDTSIMASSPDQQLAFLRFH